ncbi:MAG TPA: peptidylprolyl isomerase [Myxococcota bacterium]|jgi:peptidyl-prolyl cis-trans isomerase SurA
MIALALLVALADPAPAAAPVDAPKKVDAAKPDTKKPDAKKPDAKKPDDDAVVVDRIVAVVNKDVVLLSEVEALLDQSMQAEPLPPGADPEKARTARRDEMLDTLIAEKLLDDEVKKLRIDVTDAEVDRVVQGTIQEHNLTMDTLKMALQRQGLTLEEYREGLKKQLTKMKIVQLKVKNRVNIDDTSVAAKKKQLDTLNALDYKVKARHILFLVPPGDDGKAAEKKALAAKARIDKGEKFEDVAKELSDDAGSKDRGGDLGEFGRGEMVPEFERAAFAAAPGTMVGPIRTSFGWHLILVESHVTVAPKTGEAALNDIRQRMYTDELELQFRQYLDDLKRDAHIEKRL